MNVLMISGDKAFKAGHPRFDLQRSAVDELQTVYWGRGSFWPQVPRGAFNVVTVQDPFWRGFFAWRAARRAGAPLNVQVHTDLMAQSFMKRRLAGFILRRADTVRVVSEKIKAQALALGVRAKITVLSVFVDIEKVRQTPPAGRGAFSKFSKLILVVSRLEPEKNVAAAINLLPEVLKSFPRAGLLIAGDGSQLKTLQTLAGNLGVENNVLFLGHRADVFSLYHIADVVFNPSWYEGFGASIVEALAAGVPVVSADVGVAKEAGAFVVPRAQFAGAIIDILGSRMRGTLRMPVLSKQGWALSWKNSL